LPSSSSSSSSSSNPRDCSAGSSARRCDSGMNRYGSQIALLIALAFSLGISLLSDSIDPYYLDIALNVGINITLAVSLNLVNGHTGQFSLGHAAFMAVGAYGAAIFTLSAGSHLMPLLGGPGP